MRRIPFTRMTPMTQMTRMIRMMRMTNRVIVQLYEMKLTDPKLLAALPELGVERISSAPLAERTSLGIGGSTDLLLIRRHDALPALVVLLRQAGVAFRFLGGGSNLLVSRRRLAVDRFAVGAPGPGSALGRKDRRRGCRGRPRPHRHVSVRSMTSEAWRV